MDAYGVVWKQLLSVDEFTYHLRSLQYKPTLVYFDFDNWKLKADNASIIENLLIIIFLLGFVELNVLQHNMLWCSLNLVSSAFHHIFVARRKTKQTQFLRLLTACLYLVSAYYSKYISQLPRSASFPYFMKPYDTIIVKKKYIRLK